MAQTSRREVPVVAATPENFAQFGTILGDASDASAAARHYAAVRVCNPSANFASDEDTCVLVLCYEPRPIECRFLERHYKHTQSFIPLEGKPMLGFFAPANDREEPDLDKVVCFTFDGAAGFVMHKGVWHEQPFPLEPGTKAVCILRNETVRELKPTDEKTKECHGQDIDKLNIEARHNLIFTADAGAAAKTLPRTQQEESYASSSAAPRMALAVAAGAIAAIAVETAVAALRRRRRR